MKKCIKCGIEKELTLFYVDKRIKDGYRNKCKSCVNIENDSWRKNNKEKTNILNRRWRKNNPDKVKEFEKRYREKEDRKIYKKEYDKTYMKKYYEENKEKLKEKNKEYKKEWNKNNKVYYKNYSQIRRKNDPLFSLSHNIRNKILYCLKNNKISKNSRTEEILGCSFDDFKIYIESKFESWMTWENRGLYNGEFNYGWDIDHIIPLSSAENENDIIKLCHFTNLQPLCSKINRDIKKWNLDYIIK
jgi:hypothetical protein